jgi:uncharacterized protein
MNNIIIAGGTGFVGEELSKRFRADGYRVLIVSRSSGDIQWSEKEKLQEAISNSALVLNLAGKSVNCRFTEANKKELLASRISSTQKIGEAIKSAQQKPPLWINASGGAIYNEYSNIINDESSPASGKSFMGEVARQWEKTFYSYSDLSTRLVALRISLVLGKSGGVYPIFRKLTSIGAGGTQGSGDQKMSWIHIEDMYHIIRYIMDHQEIKGPVNCAAPETTDNRSFMKAIRASIKIPFGFPAFEWMIRIGTSIIGVDASLVLNSLWMKPQKLLQAGFKFQFESLDKALKDLA